MHNVDESCIFTLEKIFRVWYNKEENFYSAVRFAFAHVGGTKNVIKA